MSTALIPFQEVQGMAEAIARSGLFGMKTPDQALALMLVAQAEGQHPATITQEYDIIQGRACTCAPGPLAVNLIATLIYVAALVAIAAVLLGVM